MFDHLFSPVNINKLTVSNRIAYPSLGVLFSYDRKINDRHYHFYRERAKGGAGIVTVGPVGIDEIGSGIAAITIESDETIPSFARLAKAINDEGSRSWVQLFHSGAYTRSFLIGGKQALSPSGLYSNYTRETPRAMTIEDIRAVQESFVRGAERAKEAGFNGVEIIASAGYLIPEFLSPLTNQRTDEYGGSLENRLRFVREIIVEMRKRLGPDYPITIRMAGNDFVPGGNTSADMPAIARAYEESGIDGINVTGGWHETNVPQLSMELPRGAFSYLAANVKKAVKVPVFASNRITEPFMADQIIRDGMADLVNLGRVLIADPYWPQKAKSGHIDEIRPCCSCGQGCMDELFSGRPVFCIGNPLAGFEGVRGIKKTKKPKKIMVVGAGPGGLEAATRAAEAGHHVELYDKADDIGGQLWLAGAPPHKQEIWEYVRYYETMLEKYEVEVILEKEVDIALIKQKKPDHVIIAEGAEPAVPPIEGMKDAGVLSAWDILKNDPMTGKKIAVIGGGAVGLETAHFLAMKGTIDSDTLQFLFRYQAESIETLRELTDKGSKDITVFELLPKAGQNVGKSTRWILMGNVSRHGVKIVTEAKVLSVAGGAVTFEKDGKTERVAFDTIINAVGSRPVRKLSDAIKETGIPFSLAGDCVRPAKINDAIHEGFLAVMKLDAEA